MTKKQVKAFFILLVIIPLFSSLGGKKHSKVEPPLVKVANLEKPDEPAPGIPKTSDYDALFQQIAAEEGLDWRLLSAIAYNESRYKLHLVSPRGAQGIMQIMPATARAFGVKEGLMEPETNIRIGAKLVRRIERSLKFSPGTSPGDRQSMVLASYNGGIGHVTDARRLAEKYGANPDSWADVSYYLRLKAQPQYAQDEVVKCGKFNGAAETIGFVRLVTNKYQAYRTIQG